MENKITISSLAAALSATTGKSKKLCEDFLREYFRVASEVLETGETLKIKGFGTFKTVEVDSRQSVNINTGEKHEIAPYKKVTFTPAKELAEAINAPFKDFESVEMDDEMPEDILLEMGKEDEPAGDEDNVGDVRLKEGSQEEDTDDRITYEAYNLIEENEEEPVKKEKDTVVRPEAAATWEERIELPVYEEEEEPKSRFGVGFLIGALSTFAVCVVVFVLGCFFDWWPVNFGNPKELPVAEVSQVPVETVEESPAETLEEPEPVYDTVSTTRYLTTIAREHYGNFNFWPYIYEENAAILGHPDRITPGTKVVVPDLSKYGVDVNNPDDIKTAKQKAAEIYSRYK